MAVILKEKMIYEMASDLIDESEVRFMTIYELQSFNATIDLISKIKVWRNIH